jgi:hypothetical protein
MRGSVALTAEQQAALAAAIAEVKRAHEWLFAH